MQPEYIQLQDIVGIRLVNFGSVLVYVLKLFLFIC